MDGAALVKLQRDLTGTDSVNYLTADVVTDLNTSYHMIEDAVCKHVGEKFFWDSMDSTMVSGQTEYTFYSGTSGNLKGIKKTLSVYVDYGGTGDFVKCSVVDTDLLDNSPEYYAANQSENDPLYEVKDGSLFVYPAPKDGVSVIRHSATHNLIDLTSTTSEADVFNGKFPISCHPAIVMGARSFWYLRRNDPGNASAALNEFENVWMPKVLSYANTRNQSAKKRRQPDWFNVNPL